jgi:hypothetical protein
MPMVSASSYFVGFGVLALASLIVNLGGLITIAVKCSSNVSWLYFFWGKHVEYLNLKIPSQHSYNYGRK